MTSEAILNLGASVSTPLALIGFVAAFVFIIIQQLIKKGKVNLTHPSIIQLVDRLLIFAFSVMVLGVVVAYITRERELSYKGIVRDAVTHKPVPYATVAVEGNNALLPQETDDGGTFAITGSIRSSSLEARILVTKDGYQSRRISRTLRVDSNETDSISVVPEKKEAATTQTSDAPSSKVPVFEVKWERNDKNGQPYALSFPPIRTENRHGRADIIASGSFSIDIPDARIYSVQYSCSGYPCGWSYNPNGGYSPSVSVSPDGRSFQWFRKWDGDPAVESYVALYEVATRVCVANCSK